MARAVDLNKLLRSMGGRVHLLAELEQYDWIVETMDDENRCHDLPQIGFHVDLAVNEKTQAWKKPIDCAGHTSCRGERRFEDDSADYAISGEMRPPRCPMIGQMK
jgi:hypothetical protein